MSDGSNHPPAWWRDATAATSQSGAMPQEAVIMGSGGHARSGPVKAEGSGRADAAGYKLTELPAEGFVGEIPEWPLVPDASDVELLYWERAWRTPQACIWARQEFAYLTPAVARWVRVAVRCDDPEAPATLLARLPSLADEIGMSTAGLARLGAKIRPNELAEKRAEHPSVPAKRERRLRSS